MRNPTPYKDINAIVALFTKELKKIFGTQIEGFYLTGSLTYGGFDKPSSDLDFIVVLKTPLSNVQRKKIKAMHAEVEKLYPEWMKRIEVPYLLQNLLGDSRPPKIPQPSFNAGELWEPDPTYDDNWLVDVYALREYGITLLGPEPKSLIPPIKMEDVRKVSSRDLHNKWKKKLDSPKPFGDGKHWNIDLMQAYYVLTMCRKLYRANNDGSDSKRISSKWAKQNYPEWKNLIEKAESWHMGLAMDARDEILDFIRFTLKEVSIN
ncbi:MAG TPA: aminoglycoside adenylyltransferase domain-containing protein [Candidatus Dormibacteraeota bacterium]|nr:aminoglycoside adenylyltransferase domain-containing protein [Candidatus Dormibacteraeota bacterium]